MAEHIVKRFEQELEGLGRGIREMGELACEATRSAIHALIQRSDEASRRVIEGDRRIDELEQEVQLGAVRMLALRQPMACDLREALAAIKISADLERVGDLAKSIAKRALVLNQYPSVAAGERLTRMGARAVEQVRGALRAYLERDSEQARRVWGADSEIDDWYDSIFRELVTYMMEDPRSISACAHLLFVAKNLERVGDHCVNIAGEIYFLIEGRPLAETRPKGADARLADVPPPG